MRRLFYHITGPVLFFPYLAPPRFIHYYYPYMMTSLRRHAFTAPPSGPGVFTVFLLGVFLLISGRNIFSTPVILDKNHSAYEVYAFKNGSFELVFSGEKIIHHTVRHVMNTRGITDYSMRPVRFQGHTAIFVYRNNREGNVPFFMFHRMNGNIRDPYGITPDNFKLFLHELTAHKFFPLGHPSVFNADFSGVPRGFHPCNIMVDDLDQGWQQFAEMIETEFGRDLNGRIPVTFSVPLYYKGRRVFENTEEAAETLQWIVNNAYLANHSLEHKPLTSYRTSAGNNGGIDAGGFIREQVDGWYEEAVKFIGKDAYAVETFVLPEGIGLTNEDFMRRMESHPYVNHIVGVFDSISDPWNGPVYRYIVNNSLWKQAVGRAADKNTYAVGLPVNIEEYALFIFQNRKLLNIEHLPAGIDPERLPVYMIVKKQSAGM